MFSAQKFHTFAVIPSYSGTAVLNVKLCVISNFAIF
jgi:hypothetical protein